ncbi:MAG: hypothetical protein RLZZ458_2617 [Planctomycetota bacterium]|jgi:hypothetical protein
MAARIAQEFLMALFLRHPSACRSLVVLPLILFFSAGCGSDQPRTYPARGKVVFSDGDPVRLGTVELLSDEHGTTATGKIQQDGTFVLGTFSATDGACAGKHRAIVTQLAVFDGTIQHQRDHGAMVDPRFGSYTSSTLTVSIRKAAQNEIELEVEKAPK